MPRSSCCRQAGGSCCSASRRARRPRSPPATSTGSASAPTPAIGPRMLNRPGGLRELEAAALRPPRKAASTRRSATLPARRGGRGPPRAGDAADGRQGRAGALGGRGIDRRLCGGAGWSSSRPGKRASRSSSRSALSACGALLALLDDARLAQDLEVMRAGRLRDRDVEAAARLLAPASARWRDHLQPHRVAERVQHGRELDLVAGRDGSRVSLYDDHRTLLGYDNHRTRRDWP